MKAFRRFLTRFHGFFTGKRHECRLREEFEEHIELLTEDNIKAGMSPAEARRQALLAFGSVEALKDAYRDQRGLPRLEALRSDVIFGWRQLRKHPTATAAAMLSLALAIGATTGAFRLVDAVLLRKLPVAQPERLFYVATTFFDRDGRSDYQDYFDYPTFRRYRQAVENDADVMVVGAAVRQDVVFDNADRSEKLYREYVSGNVFPIFGLQPALGRLLDPSDDVKPGAHPVAVLSHDYWKQRFASDPGVIGKTFRMGEYRFEIVGVAPQGFIGTEPGEVTDVFIPAMMNAQAINSPGWSWFRMWTRPKTGVSPEHIRERLQALFTQDHLERIKGFHSDTPRKTIDSYLSEKVLLFSAGAGVSGLQKDYRRPLFILSFLVVLVLLVACVNMANLMMAQASARAREMALRVSIGAGRWRLIQMMLVQSALLAIGASMLGALFASWSVPLVTTMLRMPGNPVRLVFNTGWRELAFSAAMALVVTLLFGLAPALRASAVQPISALKGTIDPHSRRSLMNGLVAAQIAFCILVLFIAGLFLNTFRRLANKPLGFSADRVLVMDVSAAKEQSSDVWMRVVDQLSGTPGVQSVSMSAWPLLSSNRWSSDVRLAGRRVESRPPNFLAVSRGFFDTMRIGMIDGRDFRMGDVQPRLSPSEQPLPGVGIVNETFARAYFDGKNPVGKFVDVRQGKDKSAPMEIIGYVRDAAYLNLREPIPATVYVPLGQRGHCAFLVRTAGGPLALSPTLRREIVSARSDFNVQNVQTQHDFVRRHIVRERLLATLSLFFAVVALILAATGLYGVLNYTVTRRQREIGIRIALGARSSHVLSRVTADITTMIGLGSAIGLAAGLMSARFIETLLFEVKATDVGMIALPVIALASVAFFASLPPAIRSARIDPAQTLRSE